MTALKELLQSTENKVYSYHKGNAFVILNNKDAIQKNRRTTWIVCSI